jgi:hypothetical protein
MQLEERRALERNDRVYDRPAPGSQVIDGILWPGCSNLAIDGPWTLRAWWDGKKPAWSWWANLDGVRVAEGDVESGLGRVAARCAAVAAMRAHELGAGTVGYARRRR